MCNIIDTSSIDAYTNSSSSIECNNGLDDRAGSRVA